MGEENHSFQEDFARFKRQYQQDNEETHNLLHRILRKLDGKSQLHQTPLTESNAEVTMIARFEGVLPHPRSGRSSKQSSFVNVPLSLKNGIKDYNDKQSGEKNKIESKEFEGSLLSWTHSAMSSVRSIVGRFNDLNSALGICSMDEIRRTAKYEGKPAKFNRDISAVIREVRKVVPVCILAKGDWAARELLKNTFQNSNNKECKKEKKLATIKNSRAVKSNICTIENESIDSCGNGTTILPATGKKGSDNNLDQSGHSPEVSLSDVQTMHEHPESPAINQEISKNSARNLQAHASAKVPGKNSRPFRYKTKDNENVGKALSPISKNAKPKSTRSNDRYLSSKNRPRSFKENSMKTKLGLNPGRSRKNTSSDFKQRVARALLESSSSDDSEDESKKYAPMEEQPYSSDNSSDIREISEEHPKNLMMQIGHSNPEGRIHKCGLRAPKHKVFRKSKK